MKKVDIDEANLSFGIDSEKPTVNERKQLTKAELAKRAKELKRSNPHLTKAAVRVDIFRSTWERFKGHCHDPKLEKPLSPQAVLRDLILAWTAAQEGVAVEKLVEWENKLLSEFQQIAKVEQEYTKARKAEAKAKAKQSNAQMLKRDKKQAPILQPNPFERELKKYRKQK